MDQNFELTYELLAKVYLKCFLEKNKINSNYKYDSWVIYFKQYINIENYEKDLKSIMPNNMGERMIDEILRLKTEKFKQDFLEYIK